MGMKDDVREMVEDMRLKLLDKPPGDERRVGQLSLSVAEPLLLHLADAVEADGGTGPATLMRCTMDVTAAIGNALMSFAASALGKHDDDARQMTMLILRNLLERTPEAAKKKPSMMAHRMTRVS